MLKAFCAHRPLVVHRISIMSPKCRALELLLSYRHRQARHGSNGHRPPAWRALANMLDGMCRRHGENIASRGNLMQP